jgi:hypothetical protein
MELNIYEKENTSQKTRGEGRINNLLSISHFCYSYFSMHKEKTPIAIQKKKIISRYGLCRLGRAHTLQAHTERKNTPSVKHNLCRFPNRKIKISEEINQDNERRKDFIAMKYGKKYNTLSIWRENEISRKSGFLRINAEEIKIVKNEFWGDVKRRKKCSLSP